MKILDVQPSEFQTVLMKVIGVLLLYQGPEQMPQMHRSL